MYDDYEDEGVEIASDYFDADYDEVAKTAFDKEYQDDSDKDMEEFFDI